MQLRVFVTSLTIIVATATPVLAAEFWVSQDPETKDCKIVETGRQHQGDDRRNILPHQRRGQGSEEGCGESWPMHQERFGGRSF